MDKICKFNNNFSKLQSDLAVTKQVNTEPTKRIVTLERQCWANAQYSRKECLELVGLPHQVDDNQLETKVLSIFGKAGFTIDPGFIDDCHRLGKNNDRVKITFSHRKNFKQVLQVKKDLKDLITNGLDLPRGTKIFVIKAYAHIILFYCLKLSDYIVWVSLIIFLFLEEP